MPLPSADKGRERLSRWEPVSALRHVPIRECGEPLTDFLSLCPAPLLDRPRYRYRRETLLRQSVAEMLCRADGALRQQGVCLAIIEGWRAPHIQTRMYRATWVWWQERHPEWTEAHLRRVVNRFSAPPHDARVPPPHTTGGAVDLMLADAETGKALDHASPYDSSDPQSYPFAAPDLSETARRTRFLLRDALEATGLTNYPGEYWHWSYGDQGWAYRGGHDCALYGLTEPPGYVPDPADTGDDRPLELL